MTAEQLNSLYEKFQHCGAVSTDSRRITPGSLFFALKGDNFDGNKFIAAALRSGAAFAVADDRYAALAAPQEMQDRIIVVQNALDALQRLAARHRYVLGIPILAITGTNGKTTTKELVSRVLARRFSVSVTRGNLNNHIGVPLTLLAMDLSTQFGVVEMGASAQGEIATLCRIAQPNYGIITNIGLAHLEGFGGPEGVRRGKGELLDYLAAHGGVVFYRASDEVLATMVAGRAGLQKEPYDDAQGALPNHLEGDYHRFNLAAAAAVGEFFEITPGDIAAAVESYRPDNNRSQTLDTAHNTLILDCYNANPSSMRAALDNFAGLQAKEKAVILGDMLELGEWAAAEHEATLALLAGRGIGEIYLVGENFMRAAQKAEGIAPRVFRDAAALSEYLKDNPLSGRTILLKGSHSMRLETVVELL